MAVIAPSENDNGTLSKLYASGERHAIVVTYKVKHFSWQSKCFITVGGDKSAWKNEIANPIVDFVLSRRVVRKSRSNIAPLRSVLITTIRYCLSESSVTLYS